MAKAKNCITVTESSFPWERETLEFVREQLPSNEPYRDWANFEFIADDGSINEVDLLVFTPQGIFLIEIKSRPGRLRGDVGTWTWETQGKPPATVDNPLFLANSKAKKLRSLLTRQKAAKNKGGVPWIDAVMFCLAADLKFELQDTAANCIRLRDNETRSGIMGTIRRRERLRDAISVMSMSMSESVSRRTTGPGAAGSLDHAMMGPDVADARAFENRLDRSIKDGAFLAMLVGPKNYQAAIRELTHRYDLDVVDVEGVFIDALQEVAGEAGVDSNLVLKANARVGEGDWNKCMMLVGRAMPTVEKRIADSNKTILMIYPGLLARYQQMPLLQRLRDRVGVKDGIPGLWLLIPGDSAAMIDGKAIPVISVMQRARIPESWLKNSHRGKLNGIYPQETSK